MICPVLLLVRWTPLRLVRLLRDGWWGPIEGGMVYEEALFQETGAAFLLRAACLNSTDASEMRVFYTVYGFSSVCEPEPRLDARKATEPCAHQGQY